MVLLLHGFPQTNHTWRAELPALAEVGYFAVAPNQRGYSAAAQPEAVAQYATHLLVEDAIALITSFGYQRAHIVGHDWGGQLSWLLAAHHAPQVQTLSVLSRPHPQAFVAAMKNDPGQSERSKHHRAFQNNDSAHQLLADNAQQLRKL